MIRSEREFQQVSELLDRDLRSLFKLTFTHRRPVAEADIRLASVILRKWLVEGLLGELCNAARAKATFYVLDNSAVVSQLAGQSVVDYFLTGGVKFNSVATSGIYHATVPSSSDPLIPVDKMDVVEVGLGAFLKQKRLYFRDAFFTCEDIIKFTANKLGGAHFDFRRESFELLDQASLFMTYGGPTFPPDKLPSDIYLILEPKSAEVLSGLHVEILAAAASFVQLRLDGTQIIELYTKPSLRSAVRTWLGLHKPKIHFYDLGQSE